MTIKVRALRLLVILAIGSLLVSSCRTISYGSLRESKDYKTLPEIFPDEIGKILVITESAGYTHLLVESMAILKELPEKYGYFSDDILFVTKNDPIILDIKKIFTALPIKELTEQEFLFSELKKQGYGILIDAKLLNVNKKLTYYNESSTPILDVLFGDSGNGRNLKVSRYVKTEYIEDEETGEITEKIIREEEWVDSERLMVTFDLMLKINNLNTSQSVFTDTYTYFSSYEAYDKRSGDTILTNKAGISVTYVDFGELPDVMELIKNKIEMRSNNLVQVFDTKTKPGTITETIQFPDLQDIDFYNLYTILHESSRHTVIDGDYKSVEIIEEDVTHLAERLEDTSEPDISYQFWEELLFYLSSEDYLTALRYMQLDMTTRSLDPTIKAALYYTMGCIYEIQDEIFYCYDYYSLAAMHDSVIKILAERKLRFLQNQIQVHYILSEKGLRDE